MRRCFVWISLFLSYGLFTSAAALGQTREAIVVTGGPALRYLEHGKAAASHDAYWFNFVDASVIRLQELKAANDPNLLVSWLVYRPSYASRGAEMESDLLAQINEKATRLGVRLFWFDSRTELINYLNRGLDREMTKISSFDYFGHSNKACFLFDYSNSVDTMSVAYLHVQDLARIHAHDFARDALCKSWGCHSGEYYSQWWRDRLHVRMIGAIGKTDFSRGGTPVLSDANGKWVE